MATKKATKKAAAEPAAATGKAKAQAEPVIVDGTIAVVNVLGERANISAEDYDPATHKLWSE